MSKHSGGRPRRKTSSSPARRRGKNVLWVVVGVAVLTALILFARGEIGLTKESGGVEKQGKANRLINEKSPYLLQHAYNPVEWYPWGEEAFEKARTEGKPIFLSVGYSTCHWCHVMEHESFENPEIAKLLNDWFVAIKVDREERPDVDRVYMSAAYAITGSGGWPLSVFLTPELKPFFAGTYFPPDDRYGRPGFPKVLQSIHDAWLTRRSEVINSANSLTISITNSMQVLSDSTGVKELELMRIAKVALENSYDSEYGGFGRAPKFPQPSNLVFYLRQWAREGGEGEPEKVLNTLRRMAWGGMYDHLGGGFHRYSTDAQWKIPHYEKMLYDQAQLISVYLEAYQITRDPFFAEVASDIIRYLERDMRIDGGGFFSAEDADSEAPNGEQEEGAFYVWTEAELDELLPEAHRAGFKKHYNITTAGNFEHGNNALHATQSIATTAEQLGMGKADFQKQLDADHKILFEVQLKRPRPHLDDKVLTAWNGLLISALSQAYQVLGDERYLKLASDASGFVLDKSYDPKTKTLHRRFRDGEAGIDAALTDYSFLVQGLLDLYEAGFDIENLEMALKLTDEQIELFWDSENNGFYDTATGASKNIFVRTKESHDGAEPTGNSVAVMNLARLSQMVGRKDLEEKARVTLALFAQRAARNPIGLTQMWVAADFLNGKPKQIVIAGKQGAEDTQVLLDLVNHRFMPRKIVLLADGGKGQKWLAERLEFLRTIEPIGGRATAYVCEDFVCQLPTADPAVVERQLASGQPAPANN